jgi:hypothetical protein
MEFAMGPVRYFSAMQMHTLLISAVLVAFTAGCKNKKQLSDTANKPAPEVPAPVATEPAPAPEADAVVEPQNDSLFFSFERTPCFGSCPAYKVTIYQDGSATYLGRRFAVLEGKYISHVDAALMAELARSADTHGFYDMEAKYDKPVTDLPSVIIRVNAGHGYKQVIGRVGAPQAFKDMAKEVDKLLEGVAWVKVEETH